LEKEKLMNNWFKNVPGSMICVFIVLVMGLACSSLPHGASGKSLIGYWQGVLKVPTGQEVTLELEIFTNAEGEYRAFIRALEQGEQPLLISDVTLEKKIFRFSIEENHGVYEGKIKGRKTIEGTWTQREQTFPLTFQRVE